MSEKEPAAEQPARPRRWRIWRNILLSVFLFLIIGVGALFAFLNYFGEKMLRQYLQDKILTVSNGVYHADFSDINLNFFTGKVSVDSFNLIPDTIQYNRMKAQGKTARALYRISFSSLTIDRVHFWQIWRRQRINFRQLTVQQPALSIVGFPDTISAKHRRWRVIYEDIYPAVSSFFTDFHIDSVKVVNGLFLGSFQKNTSKQSEGEYEFSASLRDVSVNPFSYYNRDRVFYSREVDLVIHNFNYTLADSLYTLKAAEIGFSLTHSNLYGKQISLVPNLSGKKLNQIKSGDLYRFDLPSFSVSGVNLYKVMTDRTVDIDSIILKKLAVKVYLNKPQSSAGINQRKKKKLNLAGLYTIVARELRYIRIDTVSVKDGSFSYYGSIHDRNPELSVGKVDLGLSEFLIDSLSYNDRSRIFYSKSIELAVDDFSLTLRDGIHYINASSILFSTKKSLIDVRQCFIYPDRIKNDQNAADRRNILDIKVPRLTFSGIDLKKVFNRRILDFNRLVISEPDVHFTSMHAAKNPDPRFKKPKDFFEEENEEVVYNLLKRYLWVIKGEEIAIENGYIRFSSGQNGPEIPIVSAGFNLTMHQFLIDSVHGMNSQGYFYSADFDLDLRLLAVVSTDSLRQFKADRIHIITADSLIEAENLQIIKTAAPSKPGIQSLSAVFSLDHLHLSGLNHKKLFLDKALIADLIILDNPQLRLKSEARIPFQGTKPITDTSGQNTFIRSFEIGRCIVNKGDFFYDGQEDRLASYFSMKDIDFSIVNARIKLPVKGNHDGMIRFDSLQLKVFPLRAVIADSTYSLEASSLDVRSYPMDVTLKGIKIIPLRSWKQLSDNQKLATVNIPEIRFTGFYFDRAIFENRWTLNRITVDHPSVHLEMKASGKGSGRKVSINPDKLFALPVFMKSADVSAVNVNHADIGAAIHNPDSVTNYGLKDIMVDITRFHLDSASGLKPGTSVFNTEDISIAAPGFSFVPRDSLYTISFSRFGLSTKNSTAFVDSFTVIPNFSCADFSQRVGRQITRIMLKVPRLDFLNIDLRQLLINQELHIRRVDLPGLDFEAYLDKRAPFDKAERPPMPQQSLRRIKFPVSVDSLTLHNGLVTYEEQEGNKPGRIFFDQMSATLTGLGNIARAGANLRVMELHGVTRLMGKGEAEAWFRFFLDNPRDSFTLKATIAAMDLRELNPMMSRLVPVSVRSGSLSKVEISNLNANDSLALGDINLAYHNLAINLHPVKPGTWDKIEQALLTELINLILPLSNPGDDGKLKKGIIYYDRDVSRGFFNFVWKSILSGIKSSVGIENQEQKKIRRTEKERHK
ncbi:MAG: DUF748 domain-containing protein [Bacteroidetes bacterium]|nr:DUF748 domain-containing protein [Bacteroidota bacterium]